ncbi:acetoacetate decarboxylase [Rhodoligotrophos appendicifer]|uniref:acetoacetate decarboxylase family protein n=1 Tax=Rhodoligotrophos appendicifer TaxID=987056 RepID=UPI0011850299|nr:acetoacetate decarboxylase family protein [Rhodoligotrophos appendicifer]
MTSFDISRLYNRLPFNTTVPGKCPGLTSISFDCRVEASWLEANIADTPFTLVDDRVQISASDFSNHTVFPFLDVMVTAPVEYKGIRGGHPLVEFENKNRAVLGGREKWGYPKLYADIDFVHAHDGSVQVAVTMGGKKIMGMEWKAGEAPSAGAETPLKLAPHLLLKMLADPSRVGMGYVEILRRDTSSDHVLLEQKRGIGELTFGPWPEHEIDYCRLGDLKIKEIISAELSISDWFSSEKNGWAQLVERLT